MTRPFHRHIALRAAAASLAVAAALPALADQDWIPDALTLPQDRQVIVDRTVGSSARIYSFSTESGQAALASRWSDALTEAGFTLAAPPDSAFEMREIAFDGPGISNAKIAFMPSVEPGRIIVQFDASLK